jgi:hypothetical protein
LPPQPIRAQAKTNIMQAVPPSSPLRKFQCRMLSLLWYVCLLPHRQCKGAP